MQRRPAKRRGRDESRATPPHKQESSFTPFQYVTHTAQPLPSGRTGHAYPIPGFSHATPPCPSSTLRVSSNIVSGKWLAERGNGEFDAIVAVTLHALFGKAYPFEMLG